MAHRVRYIDLFCGIGGFRLAIEAAAGQCQVDCECVFSCDIDRECQKAYEVNFGEKPAGDITTTDPKDIPDHDILLAGFPCQAFSIIGNRRGFEDARGTLFFDIARILEAKQPKAFVLENVKLLVGHDARRTLSRIIETLRSLGYHTDFRVLNALDFGLPQKRERVFVVGFRTPVSFDWPSGGVPMRPLKDVLEKNVAKRFYTSERIRQNRLKDMQPTAEPTIWHENKAGHISAYPFSCALRAGASYNYLLVNGERRLTPREMLRLQGFPDSYKLACNYSQTRKQAGNSLPVPVAEAVITSVFRACGWTQGQIHVEYPARQSFDKQILLFEKKGTYGKTSKVKDGRKIPTALRA